MLKFGFGHFGRFLTLLPYICCLLLKGCLQNFPTALIGGGSVEMTSMTAL